MNEIEISVVIPAYNCEKTIKQCINSITNQTIIDCIEIIVVDDGSTDNTSRILDDESEKNGKIHVYHKKNEGVSAARNYGIEKSRGAYIGFVDADDWIAEQYYEILYQKIKSESADMICSGIFIDEGLARIERKATDIDINVSQEEAVRMFLSGEMEAGVQSKFFKKSIAKNILFDTSLKYSEDRLFLVKYMMECVRISIISGTYYHYVQNQDSAMHQVISERNFDDLKASASIMEIVKVMKPNLVLYAECMDINVKCRLVSDIAVSGMYRQYESIYKKLKQDIKSFPLSKSAKYSSKKHYLALLITKINPMLAGKLRSNNLIRFGK